MKNNQIFFPFQKFFYVERCTSTTSNKNSFLKQWKKATNFLGGFICIISTECAYPNEIMVIRPKITDDFILKYDLVVDSNHLKLQSKGKWHVAGGTNCGAPVSKGCGFGAERRRNWSSADIAEWYWRRSIETERTWRPKKKRRKRRTKIGGLFIGARQPTEENKRRSDRFRSSGRRPWTSTSPFPLQEKHGADEIKEEKPEKP